MKQTTTSSEILDLGKEENAPKITNKLLQIAALINKKESSVIVISGAGISVNAGIPDFRSTENGLYKLIEQKFPGIVSKGQQLFDASLLSNSTEKTRVFFTFLGMLKRISENSVPTLTHQFFYFLHTAQKLLRVYTQNIDNLEKKLNFPSDKVVHLHGTMDELSCTICQYRENFTHESITKYENSGVPLPCPLCSQRVSLRITSGKRSLPIGVLTPPILLYNHISTSKFTVPNLEVHQGDLVSQAVLQDEILIKRKKKNLLLIVTGTSCKIFGIKKLIKRFSALASMSIFINKMPLIQKEWAYTFNTQLIGDCDSIFGKIWKLIGASITPTLPSFFSTVTYAPMKALPEKHGSNHKIRPNSNLKKSPDLEPKPPSIKERIEPENQLVKINCGMDSPKTPTGKTKTLDAFFDGTPIKRSSRKFSQLPITPPTKGSGSPKSPISNPALPFKCTKHFPTIPTKNET